MKTRFVWTVAAIVALITSAAHAEWYKCAFHMHTTLSDGTATPDSAVANYLSKGYHMLVFTEHSNGLTSSAADVSNKYDVPGQFYVINGEELSGRVDISGTLRYRHVCALGKPSWNPIIVTTQPSPVVPSLQYQIDLANAVGAIPVIAHPTWEVLGAAEVIATTNCDHIEVANFHVSNYPQDVNLWDQVLSSGRQMYPIGSDDSHGPGKVGRSWTWVWSDEFTPAAILAAVRAGKVYAATGVAGVGPTVVSYEVTPTSMTVVGDYGGNPCTVRFIGQNGQVLQQETGPSGTYVFTGDELYVRAEIRTTQTTATGSSSLPIMAILPAYFLPEAVPAVEGVHLFYNNSAFDGNDPAANAADDAAIATDKEPLEPGHTATFDNYSSYYRGINGVMVDLIDAPGTPTAADFSFKIGNSNTPGSWTNPVAPLSVTVRENAGVNGSDRVTIIWADNAIPTSNWLQITVKATAATGLAADEVYYFGSAIGDTGDSAANTHVDATDQINARNNPKNFMDPALIDNPHDHNRDKKVDATDEVIARNDPTNFTNALKLISVP